MRRARGGFSLIELMVVVAIIAVTLVFTAPSFRAWLNDSRIRSATESIQNGLRVARNEASQRGNNVRLELTSATTGSWQVCQLDPSDTTCGGAKSPVFDSRAGTETGLTVAASTDTAKQAAGTLSTALTGGVPAGITYNALGRPSSFGADSVGRIDIYGSALSGRRLVVLVSAGGMVRVCDPTTTLASTDAQSCGTN